MNGEPQADRDDTTLTGLKDRQAVPDQVHVAAGGSRAEAERRGADAGRRDDAADARDDIAKAREAVADERDVDVEHRDADVNRRDVDAAVPASSSNSPDVMTGNRGDDALRLTRSRREQAASDRRHASDDRAAAAVGRAEAALNRGVAQADRTAGADDRGDSGRDRGNSLADRGAALADRVAGVTGRDSSGRNRGTALTDRAAAAVDRESAVAYAALEREMADSEARAWRLLQAMPDPVIVTDAHGIIELINVQAVALFGYQPEELIGQPIEWLIPAGFHRAHRAHRAAYVAAEQPMPMATGLDVVALRKDGTTVPVEVTLSAITLSTGRAVLASIRDVSDRRLADAELRISEERFRVSFDSAPIGMALIDLHPDTAGRFLRINAAFSALTGFSEAELLAKTSPEITHHMDREATIAGLQRLVEGVAIRWDTEKRYVNVAGRDVWVHLAVSVVHDADGHPSYGVSQIEDITNRKRTEAQLTERFDEFANKVDIGFMIRQLDPPKYLYCNPAYFKIFGYDPTAPPTPAQSLARVHPDDQDRVSIIPGDAARGERINDEWRSISPDGRTRWVSGRISPITDDDGVIRRVAALFEDITVRKNTEIALRESENRFDQLARSTEVGFYLRTSTEILYTNPSLARIFGLDPSRQTSFNDLFALVHPDDLAQSAAKAAEVVRGKPTRNEVRIIRPDGAIRLVDVVTNPVLTPDGEEDRAAVTFTDITDRRAAEDELRAARADAERASAAKDEFMSRLSHELRTPLNAVLGFGQLLESDDLTPTQENAVGYILRGGRHLLAMVNDILDITGLETANLELSSEPVQIAELIGDAVGLMQPLATSSQIRLNFDTTQAAARLHIRADRRRLKQVLLNLLSNAIKYNTPGGRVDVQLAAGDDDQLRIAVADTGIGIPASALPRLFQPFDRLGRETFNIEGTGIGLLLSQRLTTLMGGRIDVETTDGHGSTFTVTLPIAAAPAAIGLTTPDHPDPVRGAIAVSTLIYIEDNPSNVDLMTSIIRMRPNWTMSHAGTGYAGLQLVHAEHPAVVLLDLHLPDMQGSDVLHALRADPATINVPVVMLSADANPTQIARLLNDGAQQYLTKPLDIHEIFAFLDAYAE